MSAEQALETTFKVGPKYKVTMSSPRAKRGEVSTLVCEWEPKVPARLTKRMLRDYRRGRDEFMSRQSAELGERVMIVELN